EEPARIQPHPDGDERGAHPDHADQHRRRAARPEASAEQHHDKPPRAMAWGAARRHRSPGVATRNGQRPATYSYSNPMITRIPDRRRRAVTRERRSSGAGAAPDDALLPSPRPLIRRRDGYIITARQELQRPNLRR